MTYDLPSHRSTPADAGSKTPRPAVDARGGSRGVLRSLARLLIGKLRIADNHLVADLGCGSGRFTEALAMEARLKTHLVAVDPRASLLAQLDCIPAIRTAQMSPADFAQLPLFYDCILMKDAFDQIRDAVKFFSDIRNRLAFGGRLAVVQSLADLHAEPLLETLRARGIGEIDAKEVAALQRKAGFLVTRSTARLREVMPWSSYLQLVASRHLPILSYLKDAELVAEIDALRARHAPQDLVDVVHAFDIVIGTPS